MFFLNRRKFRVYFDYKPSRHGFDLLVDRDTLSPVAASYDAQQEVFVELEGGG